MSEETQFELPFNSPPSTPRREISSKSRGRLAFSPDTDGKPAINKSKKSPTKKRTENGVRPKHRRAKLFFSPKVNSSIITSSSSKESPIKRQTVAEVVTPRKTQDDFDIVYRHRQFEVASPTKIQPAGTLSAATQILNIEEEEIASGADNKVTKLVIRYHESNSTTLVVRQNHKGRDPHDSPAVDFVQAQHHPLIAKRLDKKTGKDEDGLPYVKEYYEHCAGSLTDIPISYKDVPAFFLAIVQAVKWLHKLGYTHLDLKPDNILVGFDGLPKIADLDNLGRINGSATPVNGTKSYMPPEVTHNNSKEPIKNRRAVDAWSLGCILYYLYMREAPPVNEKGEFAGFSEEIEKKIGSKAPRILNIIEKLLSTDPQERVRIFNRIENKSFFKKVDKQNLLAILQHGENFSEIYNIQKGDSYSEHLSRYQEMRSQCEISVSIHEEHQKAINDESAYAALRTLLCSEELGKFKANELQIAQKKPDWKPEGKKGFLNDKEAEYVGLHLQDKIDQESKKLSEKITHLKEVKLERTKAELEHLISETQIKIAIKERFKDNLVLCKKIIDYKIPDTKASYIPTLEEWEKKFSKIYVLIDAFFGAYNKCKHFGLYITRYHGAKTLADKIKWALSLLREIQTYPRADQIPVLEDLRIKVIKEIKILHQDHRILIPEIRQQLELDIPEPSKIPMTPTPKEAKVAGQEEEDDLISNTIWLERSKKFYLPWRNFEVGRKDLKILDDLVNEYSGIDNVYARFKYAREIIIEAEKWLTTHKSNMRYEAVEELQRCAIYTLNSLLRSLKMNEQEMTDLLKESLVRSTNTNEQSFHKTKQARFFSCLPFGKSKETVDLPKVTPQ